LDEGFPSGLAEHARAVAERYPWIDAYTPVNEPLTTARFSALYGHWYPHATDGLSFATALLNQVKATVLSMEAIRKTNPKARLVQTDDLGKSHATSQLRYQADFDNERRWLGWDLLCGRVDRHHPMWPHLVRDGVDERELAWFLDHPCPPDILGVNYYLTSERFLDHRLDRYPAETHGDNARDRFADVEAVRVLAGGIDGPSALLQEAWNRYRLPLAITECHLGCTREEQVRWLRYVWTEAEEARRSGCDVRAVTVWSLFGAHDWCSLLTCDANRYESGVFDLRSPEPRPTALAQAVKALARGREPEIAGDGWWERPVRLLYPPVLASDSKKAANPKTALFPKKPSSARRPLMIVGEGEGLASVFASICDLRGLDRVVVAKDFLESPAEVRRTLELYRPWAVVALEPPISGDAGGLALGCAEIVARLLVVSDDRVFDGRKGTPYVESDAVSPTDPPGIAKARFEAATIREMPEALIVRTGTLFGCEGRPCLVRETLRTLGRGTSCTMAGDVVWAATYAPDLVHNALDLLIDRVEGAVHLANAQTTTPVEFARRVAESAGLDQSLVLEEPYAHLYPTDARPLVSGLRSERVWIMPSLVDAIARAVAEVKTDEALSSATYLR